MRSPFALVVPLMALLLAFPPAARPEEQPLRALVARALAGDRTLEAAGILAALGPERLRAAGAAYHPKVLPYYAITRPDASTYAESRGVRVDWNTGWGLTLSAEAQESETRYLEDLLEFGTTDFSTRLALPLGRGFGRLPARTRLEAARASAARIDRELSRARQGAILEVLRGYYAWLQARESLGVTRTAVERAIRSAEMAGMRHELGEASRIDLDRARQGLRLAELDVLEQRSALDRIEHRLRSSYGIDRESLPETRPPGLLELPPLPPPQEAHQRILRRDPAVLDLQDRLALARLQVRWARRQLWPSLDLSARLGARKDREEGRHGELEEYQELHLSSDLSLDYADRLLALRTAKAQVEILELELLRLQEERTGRVGLELEGLGRKAERIELGLASLETARSQAEVARSRFERGLGSAFDMVDSQAQLQQAELRLLAARVDLVLGYYQILYLLGDLNLDRVVG